MNNTKTLTIEQFNEIGRIQSCLSAIASLIIPEPDLHIVGREDLTQLLSYFFERLEKVTKEVPGATKQFSLDQVDEIDYIQTCLKSVTDLMNPCTDLHSVDRSDLSMLFSYLSDSLKKAIEVGQ